MFKNNDNDMKMMSARIKEARLAARMSQEQLGHAIGVSDKSISAYEQGRSSPPLSRLKKMALATDHELSFFTLDENKDGAIMSKLNAVEKIFNEVKQLILGKK